MSDIESFGRKLGDFAHGLLAGQDGEGGVTNELRNEETLRALYQKFNDNDLDAMVSLKPQVDAAFDVYSRARLALLAAGMVATDADVAAMHAIKGDIEQAADTQELLAGAAQLIGLLGRFV